MRFLFSRQRIFLLTFLVALGAILLPQTIYAEFGFLGGIANAIAIAVLGQFLLAGLLITTAAATIAGFILGLAIDPSFIRVPYTTGPLVDTGWVVVRDFANMLIVFFLVIIGLATALRLGQYEAKKTLPKLIGVALLINFTPVITGFIVDTSNIFMSFFLEGLAGIGLVTNLLTNLQGIITGNITSPTLIFQLVAVMVFQIFAAIVFMLFAALFIMRRIAIWILVILSPIAFVALILPRTSGLFKMWWSQFFQWSIIGVFAAFFLWLGDHIMSIAARGQLVASTPPDGGISGYFTSILNDTMPYGIALAMLLVGFFVALQSSAMGAGGIIGYAQKKGRGGLRWSGAIARKRATAAGSALWRKYGGKAAIPGTKIATLGSKLQQWGSGKRGRGRMIGVPATVAGWGIRKTGEVTRAGAQELTKQVHFRDYDAFDKGVKETAKMGDSKDVINTINTELAKPLPDKTRILGLLTGVRNRGDADDIEDALLKEGGGLFGKKAMIGELIKLGRDRVGPNGERPLFKALYGHIMTNPEKWGFNIGDADLEKDGQGKLVHDVAGRVVFKDIERDVAGNTVFDENGKPKLKKDARKGSDAAYLEGMKSKIPARMTPADFVGDEIAPSNYDPGTDENPNEAGRAFILSILKERGAEFIGPLTRRREQVRRKAVTDFMDSIPTDWLGKHAPDVLTWYPGTGARNLGVSRIDPETGKELTMERAREIKETYRPTANSIQSLEQSIAKIQRDLAGLRPRGGVVDLSQESLTKIRDLEEDQTRQQARLARMRENFQSPSTPPPGAAPSATESRGEGYTGGTGPTRGPRPGRPGPSGGASESRRWYGRRRPQQPPPSPPPPGGSPGGEGYTGGTGPTRGPGPERPT